MSKITFRADDDLVDRLEAFDASKSEVMRDALRAYLDAHGPEREESQPTDGSPIDDALADRVDALIEERLDAYLSRRAPALPPAREQDINLTVSVEGSTDNPTVTQEPEAELQADDVDVDGDTGASVSDRSCGQCGEPLSADHVYCPNCGEKASRRVFCECGDELRSDWAFCPGCGRRTPAADVLEQP